MTYVFDSSFISALIIPEHVAEVKGRASSWAEKNPNVDKIRASIDEDEEIFVPQLFWYEITNVFKNLIRHRRFSHDEVMQFFLPLRAIRMTVDKETENAYTEKLLHLCNDYNISSYEAAYLELAGRKKAVLCTLDENLRAAAKKHGVSVIKA